MIDWKKGDGLLPAVVQNSDNGQILMVGFMSLQSWEMTLKTNEVHFFSRTKKRIWKKGETSGNSLKLKKWQLDCDNDSFLLSVKPIGPTCHTGIQSCFGQNTPSFENLHFLSEVIDDRWNQASEEDSYVARLKAKGLPAIAQKVGEEATETIIAALAPKGPEDFIDESSDLFFHWLLLAKSQEISFDDIIRNLKKRMKEP